MGLTVELVEVDVGLVEAVEQHQPVGARLGQRADHVAGRAEERPDLDRQRDRDGGPDVLDQAQVGVLDLLAGGDDVGGDVIDVELEGIGPLVLELVGVAGPASGGVTVEAGDHRDRELGLGPPEQLEVVVDRGLEIVELGEVAAGRLAELLGAQFEPVVDGHGLVLDLLLEQRRQHDGRGAGLLEPQQGVDRPVSGDDEATSGWGSSSPGYRVVRSVAISRPPRR